MEEFGFRNQLVKKVDTGTLLLAIRSALVELKHPDGSDAPAADIQEKVDKLFEGHLNSQQNLVFLKGKKSTYETEVGEWRRRLKVVEMVEAEQQEIGNVAQEIFTDLKAHVNMKKEELWILEDNIQIMDDDFHEREDKLLEEKKAVENRYNPERDASEELKKKLVNEHERLGKNAVRDEDYLRALKAERAELVGARETLESETAQLEQKISNIAEAPVRKSKELKLMEERLDQIKKKSEKQKKRNDDLKKSWKELEERVDKARVTFNVETETFSRIKREFEKSRVSLAEKKNNLRKLKADQLMIIEDKNEKEATHKQTVTALRDQDQLRRKLQCEVASLKNEHKKMKESADAMRQSLVEQKKETEQLAKRRDHLMNMINETRNKLKEVIDDQKFGFLSYENYRGLEAGEKKTIDALKKQLVDLEGLVNNLREVEVKAAENCQEAAELRSAMSRKSCAAQKDLREIQEELTIKELLIFDSNKKNQGFEKELERFKRLYESVKNERNGYVSMLQAASQSKAEVQEQFKSLQREIEILNNNLTDRNKKAINVKNAILFVKRLRDKRRHKLNKLEERKKKLEDAYLSLTSELMKMTNMVRTMDEEVALICRRNEISCVQRNALGQELVKINEEYCIIYNKFNIKTIHFKNSGKKVEFLSKNLRFLESQVVFMTNKNVITKQRCLEMPEVAEKVLVVKRELEAERGREAALLAELENPEKICNLQPVKPEELDEATMDLKISFFEDQINAKKDVVLQKRIVLDQLEKVLGDMTTHVEGTRHDDLQMSSQANTLKHKFTGVFRKVMVLVSELSIFQANVIMLEMEKKNTEATLKQVQENVEAGQPPLEDSELRFLKLVRNERVEQESRYKRRMETEFVKNIEPFVKKTTAQKRVDSYINAIGLPQPYGVIKPFMPVAVQGNLRFYRNPVVLEDKENERQ
jgi:chromosome segregation ATPase